MQDFSELRGELRPQNKWLVPNLRRDRSLQGVESGERWPRGAEDMGRKKEGRAQAGGTGMPWGSREWRGLYPRGSSSRSLLGYSQKIRALEVSTRCRPGGGGQQACQGALSSCPPLWNQNLLLGNVQQTFSPSGSGESSLQLGREE